MQIVSVKVSASLTFLRCPMQTQWAAMDSQTFIKEKDISIKKKLIKIMCLRVAAVASSKRLEGSTGSNLAPDSDANTPRLPAKIPAAAFWNWGRSHASCSR